MKINLIRPLKFDSDDDPASNHVIQESQSDYVESHSDMKEQDNITDPEPPKDNGDSDLSSDLEITPAQSPVKIDDSSEDERDSQSPNGLTSSSPTYEIKSPPLASSSKYVE